MNRRQRVRLGLAGSLLALGLGVAAGTLPGHVDEATGPPPLGFDEFNVTSAARSTPGDRVRAAIAGVTESGFHVGPEFRDRLSPAAVERVERIIAEADVPLFVVWWTRTADAGYNTEYAALDQLRAGVGRDGVYAIITDTDHPLIATLGYDDVYVDGDATGRPDHAIPRVVQELADAEVEVEADPARSEEDPFDYWGGPVGGLMAGLLFVGVGYPVVLLVVWLAGRSRNGGAR